MNNYKFRMWNPTSRRLSPVNGLAVSILCRDTAGSITFQQWSGWYDSNNLEIYQGDLIEDLVVSNSDGYGLGEVICDIKRGVWKVKYHNEETNHTLYKYFLDFLDREKDLITVVGNIFEGVKNDK